MADTYQGGEGSVSIPTAASSMTINRVPQVPFAQIANTALRDRRLSFKARGILAMVLSNVGEWEATANWIEEQSDQDGARAVKSALQELSELGYRVVRHSHVDGKVRTITEWFHVPDAPDGAVSWQSQNVTGTKRDRHESAPSIEHHPQEHYLEEHHEQNSRDAGASRPGAAVVVAQPADTPTEGQRVNRITKVYADRVPLSNFPAVAGVVRKAVRAGMWGDEDIAHALGRLADEGRAVTADSLRYELQGFAGPRTNRERAIRDGVELARDLSGIDPWGPREVTP